MGLFHLQAKRDDTPEAERAEPKAREGPTGMPAAAAPMRPVLYLFLNCYFDYHVATAVPVCNINNCMLVTLL
jgi:hypothetical protein